VPGQEDSIRSEGFNLFCCTPTNRQRTLAVPLTLDISKSQLVRYLLDHGEVTLSARAFALSKADHERICEAAFQYYLCGLPDAKAGCRAAIEIMEGTSRNPRKGAPWAVAQENERIRMEAEMRAHAARYAGGRPLSKREVMDGMGEALKPLLPGFRYYRSRFQFRRPHANGTSYVDMKPGAVRLEFGVQQRQVEQARADLFDATWQPSKFSPETIFTGSTSMRPDSPSWSYRGEVLWPISGSYGLERASTEAASFVNEIVVPYLQVHEEPAAIRETILHDPRRGHTSGFWSDHTTVFAIDNLLGQRGWLDEDLEHYRHYYKGPPASKELERHYKMAKKNWGTTSSSMT